uniref:Uncharacterized protein n=1 Tax=Anguilla anguilla TaxID=7936 RepID=A0A0E9QUW6_ANGAN
MVFCCLPFLGKHAHSATKKRRHVILPLAYCETECVLYS